jgi:hypothetical protein
MLTEKNKRNFLKYCKIPSFRIYCTGMYLNLIHPCCDNKNPLIKKFFASAQEVWGKRGIGTEQRIL